MHCNQEGNLQWEWTKWNIILLYWQICFTNIWALIGNANIYPSTCNSRPCAFWTNTAFEQLPKIILRMNSYMTKFRTIFASFRKIFDEKVLQLLCQQELRGKFAFVEWIYNITLLTVTYICYLWWIDHIVLTERRVKQCSFTDEKEIVKI